MNEEQKIWKKSENSRRKGRKRGQKKFAVEKVVKVTSWILSEKSEEKLKKSLKAISELIECPHFGFTLFRKLQNKLYADTESKRLQKCTWAQHDEEEVVILNLIQNP